MLRYILYALCIIFAVEGVVGLWGRLASRGAGPPSGCIFIAEATSARSAEQELYRAWRFYNLRLSGSGVRFAVRCACAEAEAAEICRRFCADRGLLYLTKKMYNDIQ